MNKKDYLRMLRLRLLGIGSVERNRALAYYAEMIDDAIDDGMSEEQATASLGSVRDAAASIREETAGSGKGGRVKPWVIVLLIIGSPLWLSLLLAGVCVIAAAFIAVWAAVISLAATVAALMLCCVLGVIMLVGTLHYNPMSALFVLGASLICTAIGLLLAYPTALAVKGTAHLTARGVRAVFCKSSGKAVEAK